MNEHPTFAAEIARVIRQFPATPASVKAEALREAAERVSPDRNLPTAPRRTTSSA